MSMCNIDLYSVHVELEFRMFIMRGIWVVNTESLMGCSLGSRPSPFVHIRTIYMYKRMRYTQKRGRPGLKYHVRIVGGAIGKALLLFPRS